MLKGFLALVLVIIGLIFIRAGLDTLTASRAWLFTIFGVVLCLGSVIQLKLSGRKKTK